MIPRHKFNPPDEVHQRQMRSDVRRYTRASKESKLAQIIKDTTGFHPYLQRKYRGENQVIARQLFLVLLSRNTTTTYERIAGIIGMDHASVNASQKAIDARRDTDKQFRKLYEELETKTKKLYS